MKQVKLDILNALKNSATLTTITTSINFGWIQKNAKLPAISISQVTGTTLNTLDGKMSGNNEIYSIDLFANSDTTNEDMTLAIDEALNKLPYMITKTYNLDQIELNPLIYHKTLRYRVIST